jgi:hypothetical protein
LGILKAFFVNKYENKSILDGWSKILKKALQKILFNFFVSEVFIKNVFFSMLLMII